MTRSHAPTRRWPLLVLLAAALGSGLWSPVSAETESSSRSSRSSRSASKSTGARSDRDDLVRLDEKLDRILAQQEQILQKFEGIMEELRVIKVRASN
jgi:hypothetical protein